MGGSARFTTGYTILSRVQEIILARHPGATFGDTVAAYRRGGPLGQPGTFVSAASLAVDGVHGPVTNALLWFEIAKAARPSAAAADLVSGDAFASDAATRNVLDKIEESLSTGRLHYTAARAMLFLVERSTNPALTWDRFIAAEDPWVDPAAFVPYQLRTAVPFPSTVAGLMTLNSQTPVLVRALAVFGLTHCRGMSASMSAETLRASMALGPFLPAGFAELLGPSPRVTRTFAGLTESCHERIRARWPLSFAVPDPAAYPGSLERACRALAFRFASKLPEGMFEVSVTPYSDAVNGSPDWWRTGAGANTATKDEARLGVEENPEGPAALRPDTQGTAEAISSAARMIVGGAVTLGGLWVAGRALGVVQGVTTRTKRVEVAASKPSPAPAKKKR